MLHNCYYVVRKPYAYVIKKKMMEDPILDLAIAA